MEGYPLIAFSEVPVEVISVSAVLMELVVLERFFKVLLSPDSVDVFEVLLSPDSVDVRWLPTDNI